MTTAPPADERRGEAEGDLDFEACEDAYLEGDREFTPGTARSAFTHRTFRIVYLGAFASNIGTWMQNVVLGALAYQQTRSGTFVGIVIAAQLGPLLIFSVVGGMLADAFDRKRSLMALSVQQAAFSLVLALVTIPANPSKVALVGVVFVIGVGNALYAPIFSAIVPILVPRADMSGAISLNSVQMNASRVIGPVIGTFIFTTFGASWVFVVNAVSFGFVILSLMRVTLPRPTASGAQGLHRLLEGFAVARADRVVRQCLAIIFTFSLLCLPFITQLPKIADLHLDIAAKSKAYGLLYACFGLGAVIGALSIGTVFSASSKTKLTRRGLLGFAVMLAAFGSLRASTPAYLVILVLGGVYFAVITSLSTVLQERLDNAVRGKVMALWIMGFGGTVPFGGLAGGLAMEHFGILPVLLTGSVIAVALAWWADLLPERPASRLRST
ncbi:MAG: MFS transporter [Acidimicrobiales bacterium]